MTRCAIKRGFFILRDCDAAPSGNCSACQRTICQQHSSRQGQVVLCLDCYASRAEAKGEPHDPGFAYGLRRDFYARVSYRPFFTGSYYDTYYDSYDFRSFDVEANAPLIDDEPESVGFFDS